MSFLVAVSLFLVCLAILKKNMDILDTSLDDCESDECQDIVEIMNTDVDPCEDFYNYSCGNWNKKFPPNTGASHWTNFVR